MIGENTLIVSRGYTNLYLPRPVRPVATRNAPLDVYTNIPHMGQKKKKSPKAKTRPAGQERSSNLMFMGGGLLLILALVLYAYMRPAIRSTNKRAQNYYESGATAQQERTKYPERNFGSDGGEAQESLPFEKFNAEDFDPSPPQSSPLSRHQNQMHSF